MEIGKELLTIVVQRKDGDKALDAALKGGAPGASYFYGRGKGVREKLGFLGSFIEAEKMIIMIVTETGKAKSVLDEVVKQVGINTPGKGFAFVQKIDHVTGFYMGDSK
ncbi:MAG: P-II family nitrogen regulator [Elusimicrobia bacterium]|nr:P-II family nitrogen regulator [Elusimicrobiota bacterium]